MPQDYSGYEANRTAGRHGTMGSWPLVHPYLTGKKTLDIGCSDGLYLEQLNSDSVGIEQLESLVDIAKSKGLNVICNDVPSELSKQNSEEYEAVLFSHVLEHLERPIDAIHEVHRVLIPGGTLILGLPIERSLFRSIFRHDYFNGTHLYAFSIRNSKKLLEINGFTVVHVLYHLPKARGKLGHLIHKLWNSIPFPGKEKISMAYWIIATKNIDNN